MDQTHHVRGSRILAGGLLFLIGCLEDNMNNDTVILAVTQRVSMSTTGAEAVGGVLDSSFTSAVSDEGAYVAFVTDAANLHPDDVGVSPDVNAFARDVQGRRTLLVSRWNGPSGPKATSTLNMTQIAISADGRYIAFETAAGIDATYDTNSAVDIYVRDLWNDTTTLVSRASGSGGAVGINGSFRPSISSDGHHVAFESKSPNLDGATNGFTNIFVRDLIGNTTTRASLDVNEAPPTDNCGEAALSPEGSVVAFSTSAKLHGDDTNGKSDVYLRRNWNGATPATELVSRSFAGGVATGGATGATTPSVSSNGRHIVFQADFTDVVQGDINNKTDVFRRDTQTGKTVLVSVHTKGTQASDDSKVEGSSCLSADGLMVAFKSVAINLVDGDTNGQMDIFVRDLERNLTVRVSVATYGAEAIGGLCDDPSISRDGKYVAFMSKAGNLAAEDTNGLPDSFVRGPLR